MHEQLPTYFLAALNSLGEAVIDYNSELAADIDNILDKLPKRKLLEIINQRDEKKAYKLFIALINQAIIPAFAHLIRHPDENFIAATERLKQIHKHYLNESSLDTISEDIVFTDKNGVSHTFTSQVTFHPYLTQAQINYAKAHNLPLAKMNCYLRDGVGLSGARKSTLTFQGSTEIECYHHASAVPYHISNEEMRADITKLNLQQLAAIIADDKKTQGIIPITEIRLLSPLAAPLRWFDKDQKQYDQILETYLAMLQTHGKSFTHGEKNITPNLRMFVFGTNAVRSYYDDIQTHINTRSLNDLYISVFEKCGLRYPFDNEPLYKARRKLTLDLQGASKKKAAALIKEHHRLEREFFELHYIFWGRLDHNKLVNPQIAHDLNLVIELMDNNDWAKTKYNYQLQATLVRLEKSLGRSPATGCNDCKDRDGRLAVTVEANTVFNKLYNRQPNPYDADDRTKIKAIEKTLYEKSTPRKAAQAVSCPGAEHLEIKDGDGNAHLEAKRHMARIFKDMHQTTLTTRICAALSTEQKRYSRNWMLATTLGFVLTVFASIFATPDYAFATSASAHTTTSVMRSELRFSPAPQRHEGRMYRNDEGAINNSSPKRFARLGRPMRRDRRSRDEDNFIPSEDNSKKIIKNRTEPNSPSPKPSDENIQENSAESIPLGNISQDDTTQVLSPDRPTIQ